MNPNIAHIVYASDNKFAEILGVSLVSLYENSKDMEGIVVYILDGGISDENKEKIESISQKYSRNDIAWIQASDISKVLSMKIITDRGSLSQYARLFLSRNLPRDLDLVLYLDCDIVLCKSIKELWNLDLHMKTVGVLKDAFSSHYRANIELQKNDIMFNSGVMLIDLKLWREHAVEERMLRFVEKKNGQIQQGDQGVLNAVLSQDAYCFEPRFNAITIFYDFNYQEMMVYRKPPENYYNEDEIKRAVEDPSIIHFTTSLFSKRPWIMGCKHKYVDVWMKYKNLSPWKMMPLWNDDVNTARHWIAEILKRMPRGFMIRIAGFAQAYGRPWMNRLINL